MANLEVKYLGLTLRNPIILSSSGLTSTLEKVKAAEKAGVGAVVLKSIFEEQILGEAASMEKYSDYPESADYLKGYLSNNALGNYTQLISDCKRECAIPIIASVNCNDNGNWVEYAKEIQAAGADALELNIFMMPTSKELTGQQIENQYLEIISSVRSAIEIPLSVKMARAFTNPIQMVRDIYFRKADGVVLFNRFFTPDIDVENIRIHSSEIYNPKTELSNAIRWCGVISKEVPSIDISASSGVYTGEDVIKILLCGARAAQICSTAYKNGLEVVGQMVAFLNSWMDRHGYAEVEDFIGKLNYADAAHATAYERTQFMKYFSSHQ